MKQTLEQVPASVTSVSGDYIRSTGARDFQELSSYTANTNLQVSSSSTQLLVRGFGTLNDVPGLDPSVGVMVDGVVYTYPEYLSAFFSDLDRYEVLRGPQGTLFGKNITADLLNACCQCAGPASGCFARTLDMPQQRRPRLYFPPGDQPAAGAGTPRRAPAATSSMATAACYYNTFDCGYRREGRTAAGLRGTCASTL